MNKPKFIFNQKRILERYINLVEGVFDDLCLYDVVRTPDERLDVLQMAYDELTSWHIEPVNKDLLFPWRIKNLAEAYIGLMLLDGSGDQDVLYGAVNKYLECCLTGLLKYRKVLAPLPPTTTLEQLQA